MDINEIIAKKRQGDYEIAAQILGIRMENVRKSLKRPKAKRHASVLQAMVKVIAAREALIKESGNNL